MTDAVILQEPAEKSAASACRLPSAVELFGGYMRVAQHDDLTRLEIVLASGARTWIGLTPEQANELAEWLTAFAARPTTPGTGDGE